MDDATGSTSGMQGDTPLNLDTLKNIEDLSERDDERETITKVMNGPDGADDLKGWNNSEGAE